MTTCYILLPHYLVMGMGMNIMRDMRKDMRKIGREGLKLEEISIKSLPPPPIGKYKTNSY